MQPVFDSFYRLVCWAGCLQASEEREEKKKLYRPLPKYWTTQKLGVLKMSGTRGPFSVEVL